MKTLCMVPPISIAAITASRGSDPSRLLTNDPKEVWVDSVAGSAVTLNIDLGSSQLIDTIFLGSSNAADAATWNISSGVSTPVETGWGLNAVLPVPYRIPSRPRHSLVQKPAPIPARYVRLTITQPVGSPPLVIGNIAIGAAFIPTWGREYGSGRTPIDTGSRERLPSGGFGISPGAIKSSWTWTMGDLTDDEVDALFAMTMVFGQSYALLTIEDPDTTPGLAERIHWGVFDKLEAYERLSPGATKWAFTVEDWV